MDPLVALKFSQEIAIREEDAEIGEIWCILRTMVALIITQ
jgi:hypothetical protein